MEVNARDTSRKRVLSQTDTWQLFSPTDVAEQKMQEQWPEGVPSAYAVHGAPVWFQGREWIIDSRGEWKSSAAASMRWIRPVSLFSQATVYQEEHHFLCDMHVDQVHWLLLAAIHMQRVVKYGSDWHRIRVEKQPVTAHDVRRRHRA